MCRVNVTGHTERYDARPSTYRRPSEFTPPITQQIRSTIVGVSTALRGKKCRILNFRTRVASKTASIIGVDISTLFRSRARCNRPIEFAELVHYVTRHPKRHATHCETTRSDNAVLRGSVTQRSPIERTLKCSEETIGNDSVS